MTSLRSCPEKYQIRNPQLGYNKCIKSDWLRFGNVQMTEKWLPIYLSDHHLSFINLSLYLNLFSMKVTSFTRSLQLRTTLLVRKMACSKGNENRPKVCLILPNYCTKSLWLLWLEIASPEIESRISPFLSKKNAHFISHIDLVQFWYRLNKHIYSDW